MSTDGRPAAKQKQARRTELRALLRWLCIPASALLLAGLLNAFLLINARVPSASMAPTVPDGAFVLGLRTAYCDGRTPQRGDIVFFHHAECGSALLLKRVIALPGETFEVRDGTVFLNGRAFDEPYVAQPWTGSVSALTVPDGCYILLGDNRAASNDARFWSDPFVPAEAIAGQAKFTYFPRILSLRATP